MPTLAAGRNRVETLLEWSVEEWLDRVGECQDCGQCEGKCSYQVPVKELKV